MFFRFLVLIHACTAFPLQCPEPAQWSIRARGLCPDPSKYSCLKNDLINGYSENCTISDFQAPGRKGVLRGGLDADICSAERYHPWPIKYYTNVSTNCIFHKSVCNGEGQMVYAKGNRNTDITCRCDYTRGYDFIEKPRNPCYCVPSEEDCSCYLKKCIDHMYYLSPDYEPIHEKMNTSTSNCQTITRKSVTKDRNDSNTTDTTILEHKQTPVQRKFYSRIIVIAFCIGFILVYCIYELMEKATCKATTLFKMSQPIISHIVKEEDFEHQAIFRLGESSLQAECDAIQDLKVPSSVEKVPDWMIIKLDQWKKDESFFVETTASKHVKRCLLDNKCVSVVGPPGVGKTFLVQHVALEMRADGFSVISVENPNDIKLNYKLNMKWLFVVDDMCGNFTTNTERLDEWKRSMKDLSAILNNNLCKLILTCREQVFRDEGFKHSDMEIFQTCICNLALTKSDKENIAKKYFSRNYEDELESLFTYDFFPLLCKFYFNKSISIQSILKDPFHCYRKELNNLFLDSKEGKYKMCALLFLTVCNNHVEKQYIEGRNERVNTILNDICFEYGINETLTGKFLMKELKVLIGTFVSDERSFYCTIHDKLFDFLAFYFGTKNEDTTTDFTGLLIKHADYGFIRERFKIREHDQSQDTNSEEYSITIQDEYIRLYSKRILCELTKSCYTNGILSSNRNSTNKSFHDELSALLNQLHKDKISTLIQTASSDFFCQMFVLNVSDIQSFCNNHCDKTEHYGIIIGHDHVQKYIERLFDEMTKSDRVASYMKRCRCLRNDEFRRAFIGYIFSTNSAELIQTASTDFVRNMFVMKSDDIYPTSSNVCMRYGIEMSGDLIQVYCEKVFTEMTSCSYVDSFISNFRCIKNKDFEKALQNFMSQLSLTRVKELMKNASSSFVQNMCVVSEEDIKPKSRESYMRYGMILTTDIIKDYVERVFNDLTSSKDVTKHIKNNRNRRNTKFHAELLQHMTKLDRPKIKHLIKTASQDFIYQLCVMEIDDINETSFRECERYGVIIPNECIQLYMDRWFDEMTKSENICKYFDQNRNKQRSKFKTALITYIADLKEEHIEKLIETASKNFLQKMFVTTKMDIRKDSFRDFKHYGIILPDKYLKMYTMRILNLIYFHEIIKGNRNINRVLKFLSKLGEPMITELIQDSKAHVFHQLITVDNENDLNSDKMYPDCQSDDIFNNMLEIKEGPITCPVSLINLYIDRMISDWGNGKVYDVLRNKNLKSQYFVDKLLDHLNKLEPSEISKLINIRDFVNFSPLQRNCEQGEFNLAKWCLENYLHEKPKQAHNILFALFLLVIYNNQLVETIISDELIRITDVKFSFRKRLNIREDVSAREVKEELKAFLKIMNIDKKKGSYIVSFDKVFTFFVFYFASTRQMSKVLVEYADEKLLFDRFLVKKSLSEQFKFNISLPDEELFTCIQRVFTKMKSSEEFMRYILEGNNKTNINSFTAYVGKLNEKEIITIVGGSCIDFLIKICVVAEKDKQDHSDGELELYIVIPDDSILIYIKRIFDNLATSDCVEGCLRGNINTRNETFHSKLLIHMNELNRDEVERLIHKASSDFINRMLVISEDDIKPQSCWEYERYGIVIPEGLLQIYIERVFSDMTKTVYVTVNRNSENKKFLDNLHLYTNSLAEDKLASLIQNAGSKFISRMYLSSPGETTYTSLPRLESSFIFVPKKYFKIFEQIILVQGNNWFHCSIFLIFDSTSCRIITQKYPECDLVLIKIHRKTGIERSKQKQHLMKYIDPLFTGKIIACGVNSTNDLVSKYIKRLLVDWNNGHVHDVFGNINLSNSSFLFEFITHLRNIDYERQSTLARTEDTNTRDLPLAVCSSVGILELAKWCLDNNADTNRGNAGFHPLYIACVQNHPDIVSLLLNHSSKADVNYSAGLSPQFSPLCAACACGYKTIVSLLIKEDVDVNCNRIVREKKPLYEACENGYYEIVSLLLDKKSETIKINMSQALQMVSCGGNTPLYIACTKGHTKIVSLLLNHTADEVDVNKNTKQGETPLYAACKCGYTDIVDLLLAHEIRVINKSKIDGASPLFIACQEGHVEVVSSLLKHNIIEIDQCMLIGMSPLFIASLLGHTEIVKMLLERKANAHICVKKKEMVTQIFNKNFGVRRQPETLDSAKYIKFLRKLVSNNVTEHVKSYIEGKENDWVFNSILGASPLHMGSLMGHTEIVKLLVERNSDINSFNEKGSTPLILAYELGHTDIVQVLLANGADPP